MSIRFFARSIFLVACISSGPIFASAFTDEEKAEIRVLYKMASKVFRSYLDIKDTSNKSVRDKFAQIITQALDNSCNNLSGQLKRDTSNDMQWYGKNRLDIQQAKNQINKTHALGELSEKEAYYAGSIDALEYSTSLFLIKSCEVAAKEFFEHFVMGYDEKKGHIILYPKSGIEQEKALQSKA